MIAARVCDRCDAGFDIRDCINVFDDDCKPYRIYIGKVEDSIHAVLSDAEIDLCRECWLALIRKYLEKCDEK